MFLITGASGNVGREVTRLLLEEDTCIRVLTRDANKFTDLRARVDVAVGDVSDPASLRTALQNIEAIYLMSPRGASDIGADTIKAITEAGVPRVIFQSSYFAGVPQSEVGQMHKAVEDTLWGTGLKCTVLRPSGFMSNTFQWLNSIRTNRTIFNPMGSGKVIPVAPKDIAVVAVKALLSDPGTDGVLTITGDEVLTVPEQARILSEVLETPLNCVDITAEQAIQNMLQAGIPHRLAAMLARSFELVRQGYGSACSDTVRTLTGRPAVTYREWAEQHKQIFLDSVGTSVAAPKAS